MTKALGRFPSVTDSAPKNPSRAENTRGNPPVEAKATSTDPAQAERQEKKVHGVAWGMSFDQAREVAAAGVKPILIEFCGLNCPNCRLMEQQVLPSPEVLPLLQKFVTVQLFTDFVPISSITAAQRGKLAKDNQERLAKFGDATNPCFAVLSPTGDVLGRLSGYHDARAFADFLSNSLQKLPAALDMVSTGSPSAPR